MNTLNSEWDCKILRESMPSAAENMQFDESLLNTLKQHQRIERWYTWQTPGITISYKQKCPDHLNQIDHAKRMTGGGIVFHSPGDIVFSISCWLDDPNLPGSPIQKLTALSHRIQDVLTHSDIALDKTATSSPINYDYCTSYPTPFEIIIHGQKRCGLTIRKFRKKCLIQGIIHCAKTDPSFASFISLPQQFTSQLNIKTNKFLNT